MTSASGRKTRTHNINLQALEVFCEAVRLESFSRGGASVGISQSAVSQLIAHLETELGFDLIDRGRRPLRPTLEGRIYYQGCQELLHGHRSLLEEVRLRRKRAAGTVRVASIYSVGLHALSRYIRRFMAGNPGLTAHLEYLHPNKVYSAVLNDEADLGVISYPRVNRQLEVKPWLSEVMVVAVPAAHRLAGRRSMPLCALHGEKFVAFDRELEIRRVVDRALKAHHVDVDVVSEFDNIETIKQALEISEAASILPRSSMQREIERKTLVEIVLEGVELVRPVAIVYKRKRRLSLTARRFLETLFAEENRDLESVGSS